MSDTTGGNGQVVDRRRVLVCLGAALAVHGALLIVFALGLGSSGAQVLPPVTIDLQATGLGSELTAPSGGASAGTAAQAGAPAAGPAVPAVGKGAASSGGFVIPTPRAQPAETAPSSGSAFREAGGKTGVAKGIPSVPGPSSAPAVAPVQQGSGSGASSSSGASAAQRSGTGVAVPGPAGSADSPLDLSKLNKAFASGGAGNGGQRAGGAAGSGGASGSGGAAGAGGGRAGQGYNVVWGSPEAGRGRTLVFSVTPKVPPWVSEQGLTLSVKVGFTVLPDGVITASVIEQSSGYADVDARVMEAIRMCLFNAVPGAAPARGSIPYLINPR
jgi:TonB family protein